MTTRRLRGLDAAFLYLETPSQHMHVTATMLLEPDTGADHERAADEVTETLLRRLAEQDAFRSRIVAAPLGIAHPTWVDVPGFRPREHARSLALAAPGTIDQLREVVGNIAAVPLDRSRPLWELWTITGVEGGRIGVVLKVHHAMLDGVAGLEVLGRLFTAGPETGAAPPPSPFDAEPDEPSALRLAAGAMAAVLRAPTHVAHALMHTARAAVPFVRTAITAASALVAPILPFSAPRSSLNHALTPERAVAFGHVALASVKEIKCAHGVTVNDVVLAAVTHALGDYLRAHGEPTRHPIVASVPVSEHAPDDVAAPSNRVSVMFVGLPVHLTRTEDILAFIHAQAHGAKEIHAALGPSMLADWAELAPPGPLTLAAGLYSRWQLAERLPPPHSIVVSNVPGPPCELWVGNARLAAAYPLGPVLEGAGINVSVVSYAGSVDVGLITCPRAVPDPAELARGFERAIAEMLASVRQAPSPLRAVGA
jgi:diacylglycerol O-acyltransferase